MNEVSTMATVDNSLDKIDNSLEKIDDSLEHCIRSNNVSKARLLIERGADVNGTIDGVPYLNRCISYGTIDMARLLVENGALDNASVNL